MRFNDVAGDFADTEEELQKLMTILYKASVTQGIEVSGRNWWW